MERLFCHGLFVWLEEIGYSEDMVFSDLSIQLAANSYAIQYQLINWLNSIVILTNSNLVFELNFNGDVDELWAAPVCVWQHTAGGVTPSKKVMSGNQYFLLKRKPFFSQNRSLKLHHWSDTVNWNPKWIRRVGKEEHKDGIQKDSRWNEAILRLSRVWQYIYITYLRTRRSSPFIICTNMSTTLDPACFIPSTMSSTIPCYSPEWLVCFQKET